MDKVTIRNKYIEYVLEQGHKPNSVFSFAKSLGMEETDFYTFYSSFEAIESEFWKSTFDEALEKLAKDKTYKGYGSKDKLLTFYFVWIAILRNNRSYVLSFKDAKIKSIALTNASLSAFKTAFLEYASQLVKEGTETKELKERKFISDKYHYGLWIQTMFVLNYWVNDNSANFEMTDAAIEKAVNLSFKLLADNTLDNVIDFGKFLFQKAV
ncbi:MAG: TetR family transcriptional regulator C-terminal domain-containing protein [Bacteroidota bacterium]|nr:TetR family transcriptional regulator C-terminal domain-containing protein [Bacteroidota bacterium]